jgi:hypothetical protein
LQNRAPNIAEARPIKIIFKKDRLYTMAIIRLQKIAALIYLLAMSCLLVFLTYSCGMLHWSNVIVKFETMLHEAARMGDVESMKDCMTLSDVKSMETRTSYGCTPLHTAALHGHWDAVVYLVRHGADVRAKCYNGASVLHLATISGSKRIVELFLTAGVGVNDKLLTNGATALHIAASHNFHDLSRIFFEAGADPYARRDDGKTPTSLAR